MAIPKDCLISLELVLSTEYGKKIGEFMYQELASPKHCLLSSFILFEKNNPKWKYYFDLLPKDFSNFPIFYTDTELNYLKGSPFLHQIIDKKSDMKRDYLKLCERVPYFINFSFQEFMKARMIISSRIFGISINNYKTDVLVPFADLLNHKRPRQTQWYYDNKIKSFVIQATEDIEQGKEIYDSYGKKTNGRFLLNYGFAIENNDSSEYALSVIFDDCYPLYEIKKKIIKNGKNLIKTFYLNNNLYESQIIELLSFLRFCMFSGNINDLMNIKKYKNNDIYNEDLETDKKIYKEDKNISFNYKNCLLLTMSEKNVLNYYIYFCEYCLDLFKVKDRNQLIEKLSSDVDFQFEFYIQEAVLKLVTE